MNRLPKEVIYRHAFRETADYFGKLIEDKRKSGNVAILVNSMYETLYFMPCNDNGMPDYHQLSVMNVPPIAIQAVEEAYELATVTVEEITIMVEKPLVSMRNYYDSYPIVFMWQGRQLEVNKIPIEKLNVKELLKLSQNAVKTREGLVIDEAFKNKIYK